MSVAKIFVNIFLAAVLVGGVGLSIYFSTDTDGTPGVAASGTLTQSGNSKCGEYVNITLLNGTVLPFKINVTGSGCTGALSHEVAVSLTNGSNSSVYTASNITTAMNANASFSAVMTASNATNQTIVTYNTVGTAANSISTIESMANGSWSGSTLSGGVNTIEGWGVTTILLWGFLSIIGVAALILALLKDMGIKI